MKIKITTTREPWANDQPWPVNSEIETDDETARALIDADMAKEITDADNDSAGRPADHDADGGRKRGPRTRKAAG